MIIILIIYGFWLRQDNNKHQTSVLHHNGTNTFPHLPTGLDSERKPTMKDSRWQAAKETKKSYSVGREDVGGTMVRDEEIRIQMDTYSQTHAHHMQYIYIMYIYLYTIKVLSYLTCLRVQILPFNFPKVNPKPSICSGPQSWFDADCTVAASPHVQEPVTSEHWGHGSA